MDPVKLPGRDPIPAKLPRHTRDRIRIAMAHREALGYDAGDEREPSREPSVEALLMVACGAIGVCCDLPGVPRLAAVGYDVAELGEHVFDHLAAVGLGRELYQEGARLIREIVASLPTPGEVEEAASPFAETREPGTAASPVSA
jgi:hypothetical protein